jgi:hypothetical protein
MRQPRRSGLDARSHHPVGTVDVDGLYPDPHFSGGGLDEWFINDVQNVGITDFVEYNYAWHGVLLLCSGCG